MSYEESMVQTKGILAAAQMCLQHGHWDSAVSRSSFAMLWTAVAALEKIGVDVTRTRRTHERVQSELGLHIVTGRLALP